MLNVKLKHFAEENHWKIQKNAAYGPYKGYLTYVENSLLSIAMRFLSPEAENQFRAVVGSKQFCKKYAVASIEVHSNSVEAIFTGSVKKLFMLMDALTEQLQVVGANGMTHCSACGMEIPEGQGVTAMCNNSVYYLHEGCYRRDSEMLLHTHEERKKSGNIFTGLIGALLGAAIGAIPWAIAYYNGWFMAVLGLLIGFLAQKGYELLKGRENVAKGIVLIIAVIFGVLLGETSALTYAIYSSWCATPEFASEGLTIFDAFLTFFYAIGADSELLLNVLEDTLLGLFFAVLGVWQTLAVVFRSVGKRGNTLVKLD